MKKDNFELFFLTTIALVSFSFSLFIGFQFKDANPVFIWDKINQIKVSNIYQNKSSEFIITNGIHFINGIPYKFNSQLIESGVSSFYQTNIKNISTSNYWKLPLNENKAKLIISEDSEINLVTEQKYELPIISIIVEPDDFFSYENGIYVKGLESDFSSSTLFYPFPWNQPANYYKKQNDKRKIHFTYYNKKGVAEFNTFAYAEINGKATRCFPQKSLKLTASNEFGSKKFKYDFFKENKYYKTIVLRNGGNDNTKSLFRDMLMQSLMRNSKLPTSGFIPCEVFINGEYWGIHFIQNKFDVNYIAVRHDEKEKNVTLIESWQFEKGSELEYNKLIASLKQMKNDFNSISEIIDMENLISFLAAEIYFANTDWPNNNINLYKISKSEKHSKWKFILNDLDYGFGYTGESAFETDMFEILLSRKDLFSKMFQGLMHEPKFRLLLKNELTNLMNLTCSNKLTNNLINKISNELKGSINNHTLRWRKPTSSKQWETEIEVLKKFSINRPTYIKKFIIKYLN
jgi:hypothetical protein